MRYHFLNQILQTEKEKKGSKKDRTAVSLKQLHNQPIKIENTSRSIHPSSPAHSLFVCFALFISLAILFYLCFYCSPTVSSPPHFPSLSFFIWSFVLLFSLDPSQKSPSSQVSSLHPLLPPLWKREQQRGRKASSGDCVE